MKKLDERAKKVFVKIYSLLNEEGYVKINNSDGGFMPLCVEKVGTVIMNDIEFEKISLAHYYEQNGDLMADPEMIFLYNNKLQDFIYPVYFKKDSFEMDEDCLIMDGKTVKEYRVNRQNQHNRFANIWLKNLKWQQDL